MEEMHRAGWGGRSPKLLCSVQVSCPPSTSRLQLLEPSHALQLGVLTEVLLRRHSNGLVISSASRPPSLLGRWRGLAEFQPSYHWFGSPGNQPPSVGAFQKPIHRSSGVVERDTLGITTDSPFTFTYEIPRVLELLMKLQEFQHCARKGDKDQIYVSLYKSQHHSRPLQSSLTWNSSSAFCFLFFWSFVILMFQWRNVLNVKNKPVEELGENTFLSSFGSVGKTFASKNLKKCQTQI